MKKRLLSAALALAMVLTMLPLTVFADPPVPTDVMWYNAGAKFATPLADGHAATAVAAGWYSWTVDTANGNKRTYTQQTSGVVNSLNKSGSAKWFSGIDNAIDAGWQNIQLIDGQTITGGKQFVKSGTVTIELNGQALGGDIVIPAKVVTNATTGATGNNPLTGITVRNGSSSSFDVKVGQNAADGYKANNTAITIQNVSTTGTIDAYYTTNCTVNVNSGATVGAITLNGTSGGAVNVSGATTGLVTIATTGTAKGGTVTATDATLGNVNLTGVQATLTGTNAHVGTVTLLGHDASGLTEQQKGSLAAPSVTLNGGSATIANGTGEALTKAYTVTLNTNAQVSSINLDNATINVNNSAAGDVTLKSGALNLKGDASGHASAGTVALGDANKVASLNVQGTYVSTGNISKNGGTVYVTVPDSDTNTFGTIGAGIGNQGISGGVWAGQVPAGNLSTSLVYQATSTNPNGPLNGKFVYYTQNQFQKLVDAYQLDRDVVITLVKDGGTSKSITFKNGNDVLTVIKYSRPSMPITLPTTVNGGAVSKWTEYKDDDTIVRDLVNTAGYSTPSPIDNRILNAQVTDNSITKLVGASTSVPGLTVRLVGNVITLSGAIPQNTTSIKIDVTTDGNPQVTVRDVEIIYDVSNGSVRFANQSLSSGMWITNDWAYLVMPNDTTRYSLNGSGLKAQAPSLPESHVHGYEGDLPVFVNVTCSGTGWTTARKNELAGRMGNGVTSIGLSGNGSSGLTLTNGSKVVFKNSPAVQEALNAVIAGISESQVNTWLTNAQNVAYRKVHNTTPDANGRNGTGYHEVHLVAYMAVTISNYNTASNPGTLTMTLTPSYYVEVTGDNGAPVDSNYTLLDNVSAEVNAKRPVSGRALGSLTGDVGTISLTLQMENTTPAFSVSPAPVAHQNSTYAYPATVSNTTTKFDITHATNGSLGTFVINGEPAMVTRYDKDKDQGGTVQGRYDTLQAAVDDAKNGEYIDVDANYKGSCAITVTGLARKFQINTHGANRVTSNVTGVVTEKTSGTLYEVQLEKDTIVSATTITVAANNNGTTTTNVSSAAPGSTVTITATPKDGYKVGTPTVKTNTGASVTVSGSNGSYTFTVPAGATSITITPNYVLNTGLPFEDVAATAWYFDGVKYCYETTVSGNRLMQGYDNANTQFGPTHNFTRAEMVTILWNLRGRPAAGVAMKTYTDVPASHWAYSAITWAANNGYADGYGNGRFGPDNPVLRDELVEFLWKFAGRPAGLGSLNSYSDGASVPQWARNSMSWAVGYNILSGRSSVGLSGTIYPVTAALRCEVAVTVMQYHRLYG